jgi:hypothetical protein
VNPRATSPTLGSSARAWTASGPPHSSPATPSTPAPTSSRRAPASAASTTASAPAAAPPPTPRSPASPCSRASPPRATASSTRRPPSRRSSRRPACRPSSAACRSACSASGRTRPGRTPGTACRWRRWRAPARSAAPSAGPAARRAAAGARRGTCRGWTAGGGGPSGGTGRWSSATRAGRGRTGGRRCSTRPPERRPRSTGGGSRGWGRWNARWRWRLSGRGRSGGTRLAPLRFAKSGSESDRWRRRVRPARCRVRTAPPLPRLRLKREEDSNLAMFFCRNLLLKIYKSSDEHHMITSVFFAFLLVKRRATGFSSSVYSSISLHLCEQWYRAKRETKFEQSLRRLLIVETWTF